MPDKPLWLHRLTSVIEELGKMEEPWVDRPVIESLLGVGRRRAQQILCPIVKRRIGSSVVADRQDVIQHLQKIAAGQAAYYEERRQKHLWTGLAQAREEWLEQPPVLVELETASVRRLEALGLEGLPDGIELQPGTITVRFRTPDEALEKLMALAMAISRSREAFEEQVALPQTSTAGR